MNFLICFKQLVISHLGFLAYYLNPLVTKLSAKHQQSDQYLSPISGGKTATEFLFPITAMIANTLHGVVYVVYAAEGHFDLETIKGSPVMMYHQIAPRIIWHQLDGTVAFAHSTVIAIFCALLVKRSGFTAGRYQVISENGKNDVSEIEIGKQSKVFLNWPKNLNLKFNF